MLHTCFACAQQARIETLAVQNIEPQNSETNHENYAKSWSFTTQHLDVCVLASVLDCLHVARRHPIVHDSVLVGAVVTAAAVVSLIAQLAPHRSLHI